MTHQEHSSSSCIWNLPRTLPGQPKTYNWTRSLSLRSGLQQAHCDHDPYTDSLRVLVVTLVPHPLEFLVGPHGLHVRDGLVDQLDGFLVQGQAHFRGGRHALFDPELIAGVRRGVRLGLRRRASAESSRRRSSLTSPHGTPGKTSYSRVSCS